MGLCYKNSHPDVLCCLLQVGAHVHAEGTDLLGFARDGVFNLSTVVSISAIAALKGIQETPEDVLRIGALTPISEIAANPIVTAKSRCFARSSCRNSSITMNNTRGKRRMPEIILINKRFQGPPTSGNGGYVCGLLSQFIDGPAAIVRLLLPTPLDTELEVRETEGGVVLLDGGVVLAEARPAKVMLEPPACPSYEAAVAASRRYRGFTSHWFPGCFVCGPDRGDGLHVFPGPVEGGECVACPWIPDASVASAGGSVSTEFLWAVLDCPGSFTFSLPAGEAIVLGELQAEIFADVSVGEHCVLVAWQIASHGRKHHTATALFGESGACLALGLATFLTVPKLAWRKS